MNNNQKIKAFLSPLSILVDALIVFFKTTIGIVLLWIVSIVLLISIIVSFIHHRIIERRDYYPPFERTEDYYMDSYYPKHNRFDFLQKEFDAMTKEISTRQQDIFRTMNDDIEDTDALLSHWDWTGNQSMSKYSDINGHTIGYALTISNDMIQGTVTGSMSQQIIDNFKKAHILLTGSSFQLPYTLQNLETIVSILEWK